jgi:hypothetical protein
MTGASSDFLGRNLSVARWMGAADQRQEHGVAQSAHEVVPLGICTPSPGPVNIEEPIPINVKKREKETRFFRQRNHSGL